MPSISIVTPQNRSNVVRARRSMEWSHPDPKRGKPSLSRPHREDFETHRGDEDFHEHHHDVHARRHPYSR